MFENNLITIEDIQGFKPLSINTDVAKKVDPFTQEAQEFDLRPFVSDEFYLQIEAEVLSSPPLQDQKIKDLWEGSIYVCGTSKFINPGLKSVLVYYSYARYLSSSNTDSTASGMMEKFNEHSKPISEATRVRLIGQAMSGGQAFESRVRHFLITKSEDYPLFDCGNDQGKTGGIRMSAVGGNSNSRRHPNRNIDNNYYNE